MGMEDSLRIAIIGDYNFAYHSHNATNQALQHCEDVLEIPINYYWLNERECCEDKIDFSGEYDGVLVRPDLISSPFIFNPLFLNYCKRKRLFWARVIVSKFW
jgi:CTP synthase (UTP-ammonia lyase)